MPFPDDFNTRAYATSYERPIIAVEPPLNTATRDDITALLTYRHWLVVALTSLRQNPWEFDSTEIPPHDYLLADAEAFLEQMDKAIAQARQSREAWS